ncbi:MAG: hypothetical protein H8D78_16960, partial [Chloroflexi bacterium]|nr:hypothetical protein [Chloroflexota bacterium]
MDFTMSMMPAPKYLLALLLLVCLLVGSTKKAQAASPSSFCFHAPYNSRGHLFPGDRQGFLNYIDERLKELNVECLRHSGVTGLVPEWIDHPQFGWPYLDEVFIHGAGVVGEEQLVTVWFWQKEDKDRALEILEEALARYDGD